MVPRRRSRKFLSTPSARRATKYSSGFIILPLNFYPRPPRGGRQRQCCNLLRRQRISIHALREEGDTQRKTKALRSSISIHALREEGDLDGKQLTASVENFYPRPPRGGRPDTSSGNGSSNRFLSTPSARRATLPAVSAHEGQVISIHALREEGDQTRSHCRR